MMRAGRDWSRSMVDLDNLEMLRVDRSGMLDLLLEMPEQVYEGEHLGQSLDLPPDMTARMVVVTGLGGSSISGGLLQAYLGTDCRVPIWVNRSDALPAFVG